MMENIVIGEKMEDNKKQKFEEGDEDSSGLISIKDKEEDDIVVELEKRYKKKRKNMLLASLSIGTSIIFLEISLLIFIGSINMNIIFGIISLIIASILISVGIFLNNC